MAKFSDGLVSSAKKAAQEQQKQENLRKKYNVSDDVKIIEKNNVFKFTVRAIFEIIKTIATIILCFLALVGILSIVYPDTRTILFSIFMEILNQVTTFLQ